jgi:hypothetical protein
VDRLVGDLAPSVAQSGGGSDGGSVWQGRGYFVLTQASVVG